MLNDVAYIKGESNIYILGEIYNNTGVNQEDVVVTAFLYDDQNRQVAEGVTAPVIEVLPHGCKVPFSLEAELRLAYARYEITVEGDPTGREARQDLQIANHVSGDGDGYHITGEIRNPDGTLPAYAEVIATLYDGAGRVVGLGCDFLPADDLASGQMATFEVWVEEPLEGVASYALVVLGF